MSGPISLELQQKIASWRVRCAEGTMTLDDYKEAIVALRAGRVNAQVASAGAKRTRAQVAIPSAADMLSDLEAL